MAQDCGAAQPLCDLRDSVKSKINKYLGDGDSKPKETAEKVDTSWHDEMVKRASESFRKIPSSDAKSSVKRGKKPATRKRAATKR